MSDSEGLPTRESALARARAEDELTKAELVCLLESTPEEAEALFAAADACRRRHVGDEIHLRGLIEFSNICRRQCDYCGLRAGNAGIQRYRMSVEEVVEVARKASAMGFKSLVLQSGEDPGYPISRIEELVRSVKAAADVAVTLSVGEWSREDYARMRAAGADRYLLKHETANAELYRSLHPDCDFHERQRCLRDLAAVGFQVGSGCMVGLPGQTTEMLAEDLLLLRELDVDMAGIGPFIPNPRTPLGNHPSGSVFMTLKMVALARLVTRNAHLPATTALTTLDPRGREKAWMAGANVVMPLLTPMKYREHYQIYPDKACLMDDPTHCWGCLHGRIASVGRVASTGYGDSFKERPHAEYANR